MVAFLLDARKGFDDPGEFRRQGVQSFLAGRANGRGHVRFTHHVANTIPAQAAGTRIRMRSSARAMAS